MKGFVNLFKPSNMTSNDAVVKVRGILRRALGEKQKVGHLGTLDPLAEGVLPIAIGTATRLFDLSLKKSKRYIATFKFGETTPTLDCGSEITQTADASALNSDKITEILPQFIGEIEQLPPQFSAKSIGGKRAYDIAREGGTAELKASKVTIESICLIDNFSVLPPLDIQSQNLSLHLDKFFSRPLEKNEYAFDIRCGSGTYIRSLARDIADSLGTLGYMTSLLRVQSGTFTLNSSVSFDEFEKSPLEFVSSLEDYLTDFDAYDIPENDIDRALNGVPTPCNVTLNSPFIVRANGQLIGLGEVNDGQMKITKRL